MLIHFGIRFGSLLMYPSHYTMMSLMIRRQTLYIYIHIWTRTIKYSTRDFIFFINLQIDINLVLFVLGEETMLFDIYQTRFVINIYFLLDKMINVFISTYSYSLIVNIPTLQHFNAKLPIQYIYMVVLRWREYVGDV